MISLGNIRKICTFGAAAWFVKTHRYSLDALIRLGYLLK